jgi:transposase
MERLAQNERPTDLSREYGVSRKTVNKFEKRYKRLGLAGLEDQSRAPKVIPHKTPPEVEEVIIAERRQHPTWGPKKFKEVLEAPRAVVPVSSRDRQHPRPKRARATEEEAATPRTSADGTA